MLRVAARTDPGKTRRSNEDALCVLPERGILVVSDGMGGHSGGATAAKMVVNLLPLLLGHHDLKDAVIEVCRHVYLESQKAPDLFGMGATLVAAQFSLDHVVIANLGDSRAYLYRSGRLEQLTQDHSVVALLLKHGQISEDEVETHPARGQLSRYAGMEAEVDPDIHTLSLREDDRLLLCTDGLSGMVSDEEIAKVLATERGLESACNVLIDKANDGGGKDNITLVLAEWTHHVG